MKVPLKGFPYGECHNWTLTEISISASCISVKHCITINLMKSINSSCFQYFCVFCFIIVSFRFCNYVGFSSTVQKLPQFLAVPIMFYVCWEPLFKWKVTNSLFLIMRWILFSIIISIVSAWIFWEQSIGLGFRASSLMFTFLFFFYLCKQSPSVHFLESIIWACAIAYIIMWIYAYIQVPTPVFGFRIDEETGLVKEDTSRGMLRLGFTGRIFLVMAFFMALNKLYVTRKKIYFWVATVFFLFIVFQVVRQLILWSALVAMFYIYLKNPKKILAVCVLLFFVFSLFISIRLSDDSMIGTIINLTQEQLENNQKGEEDIRITEYKYFFGDWSKNVVTDLLGNGMPHGDSRYGTYYGRLQEQQHLFLSDVGYAQMYVVQGLLGLFLYLFLFYKTVRMQMPADLDYIRMFMAFMIPANIAASWYYLADTQIIICICVYLIIRYGRKPRNGILAPAHSTYKDPNFKLRKS